jgi:proline iminopeptidase
VGIVGDKIVRVPHFETNDGVRIAYSVRGDGAPIIVCHGGPSTTYEYLVGDLADLDDRATVVFHDYRGSGRSETAPQTSYTFERLADDVDELREHLGFERVTVLAHSMGGFVALHYALRHSERCERLVLLSCSPAGTMRRAALPTLRAMGFIRLGRMAGRAVGYLGWWSWRRDCEAKTLARYSIMKVLQEGKPEFADEVKRREVLADNDNAASLERLAFNTDLCDELGEITCPVLVVHGANDAAFVAGAELLERGVPSLRRVSLPGVGHHPLVEEHERVIREIRSTLAGVR